MGQGPLDSRITDFLRSAIDLKHVHCAVDVGTGWGSFARWFSRHIHAGGVVYAFDSESAAFSTSSRAIRDGLAKLSFVAASAYHLPLPAGCADLVVCQKLLCVLSRVDAAVEELCRVLRPSGVLVAIEPAAREAFYDPEDEEYTALSTKLGRAFDRGWSRKGVDQHVGLNTPAVFLRHGLTDVIAEGIGQAYLLSDARRPHDEILGQLQTEAAQHSQRTARLLLRGGASPRDMSEHHRLAQRRLSRFTADPSVIARSAYVRVSTSLLTLGKKPA